MFTETEKEIYSYYNGEKVVSIDPIEAQIRLEQYDPNYQQSFKTLFNMVQISKDANAAKEIVELGRKIFNLIEPYDDGEKVIGLTTFGVMQVVLDYTNYIYEIKKKYRRYADFFAAYGVPGTISYECFVGCWLNIPRTIVRQEIPIYSAISLAMSKDSDISHLEYCNSNAPEGLGKNKEELK